MADSFTMHFVRRLRDNGHDHQADKIEASYRAQHDGKAKIPKPWTLDELCMMDFDRESLFVGIKEHQIQALQLEFAISAVTHWIDQSTRQDEDKLAALRNFEEAIEKIRAWNS